MHPLHPFGQGNELARLGTHNDWNASIDAYAQRNRLGSRYRNNNTRASCRSNFRASSARDKFLPFLSSFLNEFRKVVGISFFFASKTGWNPLYEIVDRAIVTITGRVLVATYAIGYDKFFFLALSFSSFLLHSFFLLSFPTLSLFTSPFPFFLVSRRRCSYLREFSRRTRREEGRGVNEEPQVPCGKCHPSATPW